MTAPMDIGLEVADLALGYGQDDDVFDLAEGGRIRGAADMPMDSDDDDPIRHKEFEDGDADTEMLDSEEERAEKVADLEAALDGMYGEYRERVHARDAKRKVREARAKSGKLEAWNGINKAGSDDDSDADSDDAEGGWEEMEEMKARLGEEEDSSDEDSDDEAPRPAKRAKLLAKMDDPKPVARATQVWFSQDVFAGVGVEDDFGDETEMDTTDDEETPTAIEVCDCFFSNAL